jgi:hypothetical protein
MDGQRQTVKAKMKLAMRSAGQVAALAGPQVGKSRLRLPVELPGV